MGVRTYEVGHIIAVDVGENISDASYFELRIRSPIYLNSTVIIRPRDGLTLGAEDILDDNGELMCDEFGNPIFRQNTYLNYRIRKCDIQNFGLHQIRPVVVFDKGLEKYKGPWVDFLVGE